MPAQPVSSVTLSNLSFSWPDGTPVLKSVTASFNSGRTGLIGSNGSGKTTLLRLISGHIRPNSGLVTLSGTVGYLPQKLTLDVERPVSDLLGIGERVRALRAIESGAATEKNFDAVGDDWDVEERARAALDRVGLSSVSIDRKVGSLSGGEVILAALTGLRLGNADIILLDEPTNNLDQSSRQKLYETFSSWQGTLIVVSHDRTLLDLMDETAELYEGSLSVFGGTFSAYKEYLDQEQEAAEQAIRSAQQVLRSRKRQRIEAETKIARKQSGGRKAQSQNRYAPIVAGLKKAEAQVSAGKLRDDLESKVEEAEQRLKDTKTRLRREKRINIDLPDPEVHSTKQLVSFTDATGTPIIIQGPERIALTGRNGIGKTRFLNKLVAPQSTASPAGNEPVVLTDRVGYLPQTLTHLDPTKTMIQTVQSAAPAASTGQIRSKLAQFTFRQSGVDRLVGDLSGGELFRVALAQLLLAEPAHQLLVLDEPTNNLDISSVDELVAALSTYRGGLIMVSHDRDFLARLQIDVWLNMDEEGLHRVGHI